jgi:hypothetical protein
MSTANVVPETWELTGDDARRVLHDASVRRVVADAAMRAGRSAPQSEAKVASTEPASAKDADDTVDATGSRDTMAVPRWGRYPQPPLDLERLRDSVKAPS